MIVFKVKKTYLRSLIRVCPCVRYFSIASQMRNDQTIRNPVNTPSSIVSKVLFRLVKNPERGTRSKKKRDS